MPMISVIVPVYNVEQYLNQCIGSIVAQSICDIEILLVNDGSTDESGKICDQWALRDDRITVIHQKNAGVAVARNAALDVAKGQFIVFCDSDDYLSEDCCERLCSHVRATKDNFIFSGFCTVDKNGELLSSFKVTTDDEPADFTFVELYTKRPPSFTCNALFYTEIIQKNKIRFRNDVITEDAQFNLQYMRHMSKMTYVGGVTYFYRVDQRATRSKRYNGKSFIKQKEKYQFDLDFIHDKFAEDDEKKKQALVAISTTDLYYFLHALDENLERDDISLFQKIKENQAIVEDSLFQECLTYAHHQNENERYLSLLQKKNYYLAFILKYLAAFKVRLRQGRLK